MATAEILGSLARKVLSTRIQWKRNVYVRSRGALVTSHVRADASQAMVVPSQSESSSRPSPKKSMVMEEFASANPAKSGSDSSTSVSTTVSNRGMIRPLR